MARRRGNAGEPVEASPSEAEGPTGPAAPTDIQTASDALSEGTTVTAFCAATSERILSACAGIFSTTRIAVTEASQAAAPFLSFAQKSKIAGLATDFATQQMAPTIAPEPQQAAPAIIEVAAPKEALTRADVEAIVSHRLAIAIDDVLKRLGLSPDAGIAHQVERQVEAQIAAQEHRLLDYVKGHLTSSLEMLESTLDERVAHYLDGAVGDEADKEEAQAEVDAAIEEVREALLKNIDEVRTVDTGFNLTDLDIAEIAGISDRVSSGSLRAVPADDLSVAVDDGYDDVVAAGDGEEAADDDDDDGVAAASDEAPAVESADLEMEAEAETQFDDDEGRQVESETDLSDLEQEDASGGAPVQAAAAPERDEAVDGASTEKVSTAAPQTPDGDGPVEEIDLELEPLEELSVADAAAGVGGIEVDVADDDLELVTSELVESSQEDADEDALADALDFDIEDDDDGPAVETLGEGPDDLQTAPQSAGREPEAAIDDLAVEAEEWGPEEQAAIERYLQRAAEMRSRKQLSAAMELYNKVLDLDPVNYEAHIGRGVLHLEGKDFKQAIESFSEAEKIDPSRPASALGLAEVHFHRRQFNKAIRHYTQCLKLDDGLAQAYCNRGLSYYYQKNYKKAFLDLMRAYDIDAELPNIKKYLKLVRSKVKSEKSRPGAPVPGPEPEDV